MSKAVMLSIRPKWVEKIANGEKTIEVRKTRPKLDTPFKCYIYCTLQGLQALSQPPKRFVLPPYGAKGKCPWVFRRAGLCRAGRFLQLRRAEGGITNGIFC